MEVIYWINLAFVIAFFFWIAVGQPSGRHMRQWMYDRYHDFYNNIPTPSSTTVPPSPVLTTTTVAPATSTSTTVVPTSTTTVAPATTTTVATSTTTRAPGT